MHSSTSGLKSTPFSDENASWLKVRGASKTQSLFDEEDDDDVEDGGDEEEEDEDNEEDEDEQGGEWVSDPSSNPSCLQVDVVPVGPGCSRLTLWHRPSRRPPAKDAFWQARDGLGSDDGDSDDSSSGGAHGEIDEDDNGEDEDVGPPVATPALVCAARPQQGSVVRPWRRSGGVVRPCAASRDRAQSAQAGRQEKGERAPGEGGAQDQHRRQRKVCFAKWTGDRKRRHACPACPPAGCMAATKHTADRSRATAGSHRAPSLRPTVTCAAGKSADMSALNQRIEDIVRVLANFSEQREPGRYACARVHACAGRPRCWAAPTR